MPIPRVGLIMEWDRVRDRGGATKNTLETSVKARAGLAGMMVYLFDAFVLTEK